MVGIRRIAAAVVVIAAALLALSCRSAAPRAAACGNETLTAYPALLVLAPHPDDEVLGFAGLVDAYLRAGKPVTVVVTTDGDAYCEACRFWKNSSVTGPMCTAEELSNFATAEIDSLAEVRRSVRPIRRRRVRAHRHSYKDSPAPAVPGTSSRRSQCSSYARELPRRQPRAETGPRRSGGARIGRGRRGRGGRRASASSRSALRAAAQR